MVQDVLFGSKPLFNLLHTCLTFIAAGHLKLHFQTELPLFALSQALRDNFSHHILIHPNTLEHLPTTDWATMESGNTPSICIREFTQNVSASQCGIASFNAEFLPQATTPSQRRNLLPIHLPLPASSARPHDLMAERLYWPRSRSCRDTYLFQLHQHHLRMILTHVHRTTEFRSRTPRRWSSLRAPATLLTCAYSCPPMALRFLMKVR